jgi:benzoate-CoA ligase
MLLRAFQDTHGYLFAEGRADDMIKAGCGQWVSPFELEAVLSQDDSVADAVVVGFSDHDGIVRPKACVKLRPGTRPTLEIENRLKLMVVQRWPEQEFKHIGVVEFVSEIPRSSNGKVQRFRLRSATL